MDRYATRRILALSIGTLLVSAGGIALAQHAHFVGRVTSTIDGNTGDVTVCFKEAGLGNNQNINYLATAGASATYVCVNNGGQCPNAANKTTVSGPVATPGTFNSGQNGQISACLTLTPPEPGSFTCPGGQTLTLADVSYTTILITDVTNNVTENARPSSQSATIFECP